MIPSAERWLGLVATVTDDLARTRPELVRLIDAKFVCVGTQPPPCQILVRIEEPGGSLHSLALRSQWQKLRRVGSRPDEHSRRLSRRSAQLSISASLSSRASPPQRLPCSAVCGAACRSTLRPQTPPSPSDSLTPTGTRKHEPPVPPKVALRGKSSRRLHHHAHCTRIA